MEINSHLQAQATLCPWGINRSDILNVLCHRPFYVRGALTGHEDERNCGGTATLLYMEISRHLQAQAILCPWATNRPDICFQCRWVTNRTTIIMPVTLLPMPYAVTGKKYTDNISCSFTAHTVSQLQAK